MKKKSLIDRFLQTVEKVGNALPHPATLFALFALSVLVLSWIVSLINPEVINPATGQGIRAVNLLSREGIHMILTQTVTNFTGFVPLGTVLVAMGKMCYTLYILFFVHLFSLRKLTKHKI